VLDPDCSWKRGPPGPSGDVMLIRKRKVRLEIEHISIQRQAGGSPAGFTPGTTNTGLAATEQAAPRSAPPTPPADAPGLFLGYPKIERPGASPTDSAHADAATPENYLQSLPPQEGSR